MGTPMVNSLVTGGTKPVRRFIVSSRQFMSIRRGSKPLLRSHVAAWGGTALSRRWRACRSSRAELVPALVDRSGVDWPAERVEAEPVPLGGAGGDRPAFGDAPA